MDEDEENTASGELHKIKQRWDQLTAWFDNAELKRCDANIAALTAGQVYV